jgi:predicted lipid-binding transport protein (Tim44 family)
MRRFCLLLFAAFSMTVALQPPMAGARESGLMAEASSSSSASSDSAVSPIRTATIYPAPIYSSGYGRAYGMRPGSWFTSGLLGGFLGAGLGGLLFGGGFFQAMHGGPGVLGVLLQLLIAYSLAVWVYRWFAEGLSPVGTGLYSRIFYPPTRAPTAAAKPGFFGGGRAGRPITLSPGDFRSFEELLHCMQTAWSAHDLNALRSMTTPELAQSYARQLADQEMRGVRNQVTEVRLQQADACEAWTNGRRDFATVCLQFSMVDVLRDNSGRIVDGSETERVSVRQYWRFMRTARARWIVSAVDETR